MLSSIVGRYSRILLCGDVSFHVENPSDTFSKRFLDVKTDYGFEYHIDGKPTHQKRGSLDVVCSLGMKCVDFHIVDNQFSDHFPIYFQVCIPGNQVVPHIPPSDTVKYYRLQRIGIRGM